MTIKVAINGYGRIGRCLLRAIYEEGYRNDIEVVAINSITSAEATAHLTQYDSTHGKFNQLVTAGENTLNIGNDSIHLFYSKDPALLDWKSHNIDIVFECTGKFTDKDKAQIHIEQGAKKVMISAPGNDSDATIVYGVNHETLKPEDKIISNASCTTNCLAPLAKVLHKTIGIESGLMTTIHAYTNDQVLIDAPHSDLRRARSATQSMIPTKTGAAIAVGKVLPELDGKLDGFAMRVPTLNVSVVDFTFTAQQETSVEEVNHIMAQAAKTEFSGIIAINTLPLVSIDFNHNPASSIFDATQTKVGSNKKLVKVLAWYDNEWGFSNRMLDLCKLMAE